jgi:hypothetical protein
MNECPYCASPCEDGVCHQCGALKFGDNDLPEKLLEAELLTEEEARIGWYKPGTIFND